MKDDRRFRPATDTFEDTFKHYHGAGLVELVLRAAENLNRRRFAQFAARVEHKAEDFNPLLPASGRRMAGNE